MSLHQDIDKSKTIDSDDREFNLDNKSGFDFYVQRCKEQSYAGDFVSDITLAGHSSNGKESCGQWKFIGCLEHDLHKTGCVYCKKIQFHCNSKGCNVCFESTIKREARAIKNRLVTFCNLKKNRKIYLKGQNRIRVLSHVTVSVPHIEQYLTLTKKGRKELKQKQTKILKMCDVDGGVTIIHPYRFTKDLESAYLSTHFHNIITGWIDGNIVKQIYEKTGWIIKQISTMNSEKDCYNLSKYLLSHAGVFEREVDKRSSEHSVSYFGECQNRFFKVDKVLKNSVSGYDQLDEILYSRKEITKKGIDYPLQQVHYTHSIIDGNIKESTNNYFKLDGGINKILKSLRQYITPKKEMSLDNPALSQSVRQMEFLQMRLDYGNSWNVIVQSVYVNIVFETSLERLCPECSLKMQTLCPSDEWSPLQKEEFREIFKSIPENATLAFDNSMGFDYLANIKIPLLGMPYFDHEGDLQYETGIYSRPKCLDKMNTNLYWNIINNIEIQKTKHVFKLENGRSMGRVGRKLDKKLYNQELEESLKKYNSLKTPTISQKLTNF